MRLLPNLLSLLLLAPAAGQTPVPFDAGALSGLRRYARPSSTRG
jgi:hypothetical protein